jgi:arginase
MAKPVRVLTLPYDSGRRDERMGCGPAVLLAAMPPGHDTVEVSSGDGFPTEVTTAFALARRLAERVRAAVADGRFPVVLSGNCLPAAVGTLAGLGAGVGVAWLDAHGDFHTPETTASGFADGMAVAVVAGQCWRSLAAAVPGFAPLPGDRIVHIGGRDFDPGERDRLVAFGARVLDRPEAVTWSAGMHGVYLHLDLDVLDPREVPANSYQPGGGLSVAAVAAFVRELRASAPVLAASVTAYDPARDPDQRATGAVASIISELLT